MLKQRGFTVIEVILISVIIAGLGGIGWYVVNSNHKTTVQLDNAVKDSSASNAAKSKSSNSSTTPLTLTNSKFIFKEFGVQIELPVILKDLSYKAVQLDSTDGTGKDTVLYVTVPQMATDSEKCYGEKVDSSNPPSFVAITKFAGQGPHSPNGISGVLKQFNDFYIGFSEPNGITSCTTPGTDTMLLQKDAESFSGALNHAFQTTATLVQ